ncbi:hypothetical protein JCGZ_15244 [Jatropha curcas]|uniref:Uncharacterized protein n=1 Tax=Jatropha curcas TaxID=180498 RepID=A0A067KE52_JATCU|nr:hypothetical protein JCGZ_15244 [Jatropha curcas]
MQVVQPKLKAFGHEQSRHAVAAYPYKQCRPLHGRVPEVSALLELRDAAISAVTQVLAALPNPNADQAPLGDLVQFFFVQMLLVYRDTLSLVLASSSGQTSSRLDLIGPKDIDLMTKSSKLGLIGLKDFDLATYLAWFDRLCWLQSVLKRKMSQLSEIPASAYTPEMETLGALPDIPTFDGEPVPVSRNLLTPGTRPLQLLPSPGTEFPVRYEMSRMRGFQSEELENGRLRRHQSRQSSAVSRLQAEVDLLRTRLEVEGIPLDSSEEDEDGSASDDAPPSPPHSVIAGPSRRRR